MNKLLIILSVFLIIVSCKHESPKQVVSKPSKHIAKIKPLVFKDSISGKINAEMGVLGFKFEVDTIEGKLRKIKIYEDGKIYQTIVANKEIDLIGNNHHKTYQLIDWNFDGYKDITVFGEWTVSGSRYLIYNYSPKRKKFIYNVELSYKLGLNIDSISKYIVFDYRNSMDREEFWDTCRYVNNRLQFVKGAYQKIRNDTDRVSHWVINIHSRRIGNKYMRTKDSVKLGSDLPKNYSAKHVFQDL